MATKKEAAPKKASKKAAYKVIMRVGGKDIVSEADTALDAIMALKLEKISAKTIFILEYDGKTSSLMRRVQWARFTLNHRTVAFHLAKNLVALLK